ncbi:MAG: hypothetical protein NTW18_00675 [Candidatus Omnitrophica bacterium]|nr:hypothetical protein [Candidatus Omnitrophota bacterium]
MVKDIIRITNKGRLLAIIIKAKFKQDGLKFFVPNEYPQQLAYMGRPKGYVINSHIHNPVSRSINITQETLFIRSGKVRVDFYDEKKHYIESRIVQQGDVVFLPFGGHGFEFMKDGEIIEVKQGPFLKKIQSVKFEPVKKEKLKLKK